LKSRNTKQRWQEQEVKSEIINFRWVMTWSCFSQKMRTWGIIIWRWSIVFRRIENNQYNQGADDDSLDVNEKISEDEDSFEEGWEDIIRKNKDEVWGE
jgi:hypothetical protein